MSESFTPAEFHEALGEFGKLDPLFVTGLAKPIPDDAKAIALSPGTRCGRWIRLPLDHIKRVVHLANLPCDDHRHPFVVVVLKEPPPSDEHAVTLANLVRALQDSGTGQVPSGQSSGATPIARQAGGGSGSGDSPAPPLAGCFNIGLLYCWDAWDPAEHGAEFPVPPAARLERWRCLIIPHFVCF